MRRLFIDTWYLVALTRGDDQYHEAVHRIAVAIEDSRFITSDAVLSEYLGFLAKYGPDVRQAGVKIVRDFIDGRTDITVVRLTQERFETALRRYENRSDKKYSFVDCLSMCIMEEYQLTHVLSDDDHFTQERFVIINTTERVPDVTG